MKKASLAVLASLFALTGTAFAQTEEQGIRMSHDPQVAASIEQHAQQLRSQQEAAPAPQRPMMMHHHHRHHHKHAK